MTVPPAKTPEIDAALATLVGAPVRLIAAWRSPLGRALDGPAPVVRAVFAFPAARVSALRPWVDEVEGAVGDTWWVAMEAAKWARLMLKGHGGALLCSMQPPFAVDPHGARLIELATALWSPETEAWIHAAGLESPPLLPATPAASRFDLVDAWLHAVRADTH